MEHSPKQLFTSLDKHIRVLVLSNTYPLKENDNSAIFLRTLYEEMASNQNVEIRLLAADHHLVNDSIHQKENLTIKRFQYWFKKHQSLAYGDAILSNLNKSKINYLLIPMYILSLFWNGAIQIIRFKPDIIHAHWAIPTGFIGVFLSRIFGIRLMVTSHGGDVYGYSKGPFKSVLRFVYNNSVKINTVSKALREEIGLFHQACISKVFVKSMGVNSKDFEYTPNAKKKIGINEDEKVVLFVGRLSEVKEVSYLIDAISQFDDEAIMNKLKVLIAGTGNLQSTLKQQVCDNNLTDNVSFLGSIPNKQLPQYYSACDVLVIPSAESIGGKEGLPVTLMEGLLCKCNIVASRIGGLAELTETEQFKLVEPTDIHGLATGIRLMLETPKNLTSSKADEYRIENVARTFYEEYVSILNQPPTTRS